MATAIRILYVDDEPDLLDISKQFLEDSGDFTVTTALNAKEGIRLLEQETFDAIISDYQMPGMDGIQFLVEVRTRFGPIPFILFTGRGREEVVIQAINSGVDFYLQKGGEPGAQFAELSHKIKSAALRKIAEDALCESEKRFRLLVQNSSDIIQIMDRNGVPFYISDQLSRILGYRPEERIGRSSLSDIHPDDFLAVKDSLNDIIEHPGTTGKIEYRYRHKNGNWVDLEAIGCNMLDDPAIHGIFLNIRDITDKKRAEKDRAFNNILMSTQQETTLDAILVVDENGKILNYNQKFIEFWGIPGELLASRIDEPVLQFVVGQLADPEAFLSRVRYLYEHKAEKSFEEILLKDGRILERFSAPLLGESGTYYGRVWYFRDITQRKLAEEALLKKTEALHAANEQLTASEEKLHSNLDELTRQKEALRESKRELTDIIEFLPDATFVIDLKGTVIAWNRAMEEMTGIKKEAMIGKGDHEYTIPFYGERRQQLLDLIDLDEEEIKAKYQYVLRKGQTLYAEVFTPALYGGKGAYVWATGSPLFDIHGNRIGAIESIRDITERKGEEEALRINENRLQMAQEIGHIGCWEYDIKTNQMWGSGEDCHLFGYPRTAGSFPIENFSSCITEPELVLKAFNDLINEGKEYDLDFIINPKDGSAQKTLHSIGRLEKDEQGNPVKVEGINQDITERKVAEEALRKSEQQFRALSENSQDFIMRYDKEHRHTYANPACLRVSGMTAEKFIGKTHSELGFPPNLCALWEPAIDRVFDTGQPYCETFVWTGADGEVILDWRLFPEKDDKGRVISVLGVSRDITANKATEQLLSEAQKRTATILNGIADVFYSVDEKWRFTMVNPAAEKAPFGRPASELLGRVIWDIYPGLAGTFIQQHYFDAAKNFSLEHYEGLSSLNGRWYEVFMQGRSGGVDVYMHDITDSNRAEELVRESENKFSSVFYGSPVALALVSAIDGTFVNVNDAFVRGTGYSRDEVIGVTAEALGIFADRYERERLASALRDTQTVDDIEIRCRRKNGEIRPCLFSSGIILIGGKPYILSSIRDITERKLAEEAQRESELLLRQVFDNANDAVFLLERTPSGPGKYLLVNDKAVQMLGYSKEDFLKMSPWDIVPEDVSKKVMPEVIKKLLIDGHATFESAHKRKDGSIYPVEVSTHTFRYKGKEVDLSIVRDITERKRVEKSFQQINKKLTLLSSITRHDITNQLAVLAGYLRLLEKKYPDPRLSENIRKATDAANRISAMIRFTQEYENIGFNTPIWQDCRRLVDTAANQAPLGKVTVKNDLSAGAEVFADPLIVKVLYNLMDNAVQYGGKITSLRFFSEESGDDYLIVCEDDGNGVRADEKEKIFERGYGKNTGLGLAISREILDITCITISENGEPGKGARFEMTVPKGAWRLMGKSDR